VDAYPKEAIGVLLGRGSNTVSDIFAFQVPEKRTIWETTTSDENELRVLEWFGADRILGEWHTHPNASPTASPTDKAEMLSANNPYIGDGSFMLITSIHVGKRKPYWCFREKAYRMVGERVKRCELIVGGRTNPWGVR
jgi:proteasome lid subunit RPN8/RPN11